MSEETITLTKEGKQKLEEELNYLKSVKRNEISEKIKVAREFGDLSENSEYDAAREAQQEMEARILQIEDQLKHVKIIDEGDVKGDVASVGTIITVVDTELDETIKYELVGKTEADPDLNKISDQSPIGAALIDHKKGETVTVDAPGGSYDLFIKKIEKANKKKAKG